MRKSLASLVVVIVLGLGSITMSVSTADASVKTPVANSNKRKVKKPTAEPKSGQPAGATALCRDGSYSYSQSRRGTCSHHGGVKRWLR